jgi:hypothetical protein
MVKNILEEKKYLFGILLTLVSIFGFVYGSKFVYSGSKKLHAQKQQLSDLETDLSVLDDNLRFWDENSDDIETLQSSLPQTYSDVAVFFQKAELIAQQEGLRLDIEASLDTKKESGVQTLETTFKTSGSYVGFSNFVGRLVELPYYYKIKSLDAKVVSGAVEFNLTFDLLMR